MKREAGEFLSFEEAGRRMNCSADTVRRRIVSGGFPIFRDGNDARRQVIRLSDLEAAFQPRQLEAAA